MIFKIMNNCNDKNKNNNSHHSFLFSLFFLSLRSFFPALNQSNNEIKYYFKLFNRGKLFRADLFLNFEDWRVGSRGLSVGGNNAIQNNTNNGSQLYSNIVRSAHFSPFFFPFSTSRTYDIPSYLYERNQGLVLDRSLQFSQLNLQVCGSCIHFTHIYFTHLFCTYIIHNYIILPLNFNVFHCIIIKCVIIKCIIIKCIMI